LVTKALILAAGIGSRLQPLTEHQPKCLVKVGGKAILHHQLISLSEIGITDCIISIGHKGSVIQDQYGSKYESINLQYVENPLFATTNNIYSLYLLKDHLREACLLLESDVLVEDSILQDLVSNEASDIAVLDHVTAEMDGTIVFADHNRVIEMLLKENQSPLMNTDSALKTVNIYKFSKKMLRDHLFPILEKAIAAGQNNVFYESVLAQIINNKTMDIAPMIVSGKKWIEIDNHQDLIQAKRLFTGLH
jgi:choline kinase